MYETLYLKLKLNPRLLFVFAFLLLFYKNICKIHSYKHITSLENLKKIKNQTCNHNAYRKDPYSLIDTVLCDQIGTVFVAMQSWTALTWNPKMKAKFQNKYLKSKYVPCTCRVLLYFSSITLKYKDIHNDKSEYICLAHFGQIFFSSLEIILTLSKTTSSQNLFRSDCITLYFQ